MPGTGLGTGNAAVDNQTQICPGGAATLGHTRVNGVWGGEGTQQRGPVVMGIKLTTGKSRLELRAAGHCPVLLAIPGR